MSNLSKSSFFFGHLLILDIFGKIVNIINLEIKKRLPNLLYLSYYNQVDYLYILNIWVGGRCNEGRAVVLEIKKKQLEYVRSYSYF